MPAPGPVNLGIVGVAPRGVLGPVRADRFDYFQRIVGSLEEVAAGEYRAGHAACHALMNGVDRVLFIGVSTLDDPDEVAEGVRRAHEADALTGLVVPGIICVRVARAAASAHLAAQTGGAADSILWLDAPAGADEEGLVAHATAVGAEGTRVRVVSPWVPTVSPGRRRSEPLPATCLVAALGLGVAATLRGVHELPAAPDPAAVARLRARGCDLLVPHGRRRLVGLAGPPPSRPPSGDADASSHAPGLEGELTAALEEACAPLVHGATPDVSLCRTLERAATTVLEGFRRRGRVQTFGLRCTLEEGPDDTVVPVVEVGVRLPNPVRDVVIRVAPSTPPAPITRSPRPADES